MDVDPLLPAASLAVMEIRETARVALVNMRTLNVINIRVRSRYQRGSRRLSIAPVDGGGAVSVQIGDGADRSREGAVLVGGSQLSQRRLDWWYPAQHQAPAKRQKHCPPDRSA